MTMTSESVQTKTGKLEDGEGGTTTFYIYRAIYKWTEWKHCAIKADSVEEAKRIAEAILAGGKDERFRGGDWEEHNRDDGDWTLELVEEDDEDLWGDD
jgi:hypothetical protein